MSDHERYIGLLNPSFYPIHSSNFAENLSQAQVGQRFISIRKGNFQGVDKTKKQVKPVDTRGIISPFMFDLLWRSTRTGKAEGGKLIDFTEIERVALMRYAINQYYLGYDEGKYGVFYRDGQLSSIEITNDSSQSNTEGNEASGGITLGKDPSVSIEGKVSESATEGSGSSVRATLDQTKRNEMLEAADKLADERQKLIVLMDRKIRLVLSMDGNYRSRVGNMEYFIDYIGQWARLMSRDEGKLTATKANPPK